MGFSVSQRNSLRSPHVRGKDTRRQRDDSVRGITPACAGKRYTSTDARYRARDHPRVCGEKVYKYGCTVSRTGSPPRVRGKVLRHTAGIQCRGITPACAGKSIRGFRLYASRKDHPRVCGEKSGASAQDTAGRGITPACAGKSVTYVCRDRRGWDHPRVCGEKSIFRRQRAQHLGSPPRVRGKGLDNVLFWTRMRITPACAGKSRAWPGTTPCRRDHPRVCGEKSPAVEMPMTILGSPPRVRGKVG